MLCGETAIQGATLRFFGDDVYGQADALVRCDNHASDPKNFHYRAIEMDVMA